MQRPETGSQTPLLQGLPATSVQFIHSWPQSSPVHPGRQLHLGGFTCKSQTPKHQKKMFKSKL